jgi:anti-sigma factor RsiW
MLMSVALDDEATPEELQRLREHLRACSACAGVWEQWQAVDRRLDAAPLAAPEFAFADRVMARIEVQSARRRQARWLSSGVIAVCLAGLLLGLALIGALAYWGAQNPGQASGVMFAALKAVGSATWILLGVLRLMGGVGAPTLAAGIGLLATLTCLLGMLWLWLVGRAQVRITETAPVL